MNQVHPENGCDRHSMTISQVDANNQNINVGSLCGINTDQHLYIHLPKPRKRTLPTPADVMTNMPVTITFNFMEDNQIRYQYNIRVTQV